MKIKDLDSLFEIALVLLGVLAASTFQYYLEIEEPNVYPHILKVHTVPFILLILLWLTKQFLSDYFSVGYKFLFTQFIWFFWSFALFFYLLLIYGVGEISKYVNLLLSLLLDVMIFNSYLQALKKSIYKSDMKEFFKKPLNRFILAFLFIFAYIMLLIIVTPNPNDMLKQLLGL